MRICFWSTSFQADNQALAYYLAASSAFDVLVATESPELYAAEAIHKLVRFEGRFIDRKGPGVRQEIERFTPDLVIVDNHLPGFDVANRMLVLWHGFGWRFDDLMQMKRELKRSVGDVTRPNPRFRWQAFGEWDRRYRIEHTGLAPENVIALGSAYSDWLLPDTPFSRSGARSGVQSHYSLDLSRPVILLALTWHHGGSLGHWGPERDLLARLIDHVESRGAGLLVRMHDRPRYESDYVSMIEELVLGRSTVQLKFKSQSPDSFVDLLISDLMISNYSSILNAFYCTGRPSLHIDPADAGGDLFLRKWKGGRLRKTRIKDPSQLWKLHPDEIGGLRCRSFDELLQSIDRALAEPTLCEAASASFLERYISSASGRSCERIAEYLSRFD